MNIRIVLCVSVMCSLAACTVPIERVALDAERLVKPATTTLACPYSVEIMDARPANDRAGGLQNRMFLLEDVESIIRKGLEVSGFVSGVPTATPKVSLKIMRLYLDQSHYTKIPVLVYQVTIRQQSPFLIRAQIASMNWRGTENEAYDAFAEIIQDANRQLISKLNATCQKTAGGAL